MSNKSSKFDKNKNRLLLTGGSKIKSGGDRIRTGVQTYSSKAFYMFISSLVVGGKQETNIPIRRLAGWS